MSQRRQSWRFLALPPGPRRKRRKEPTTALLTWDAIRTLLELIEQSADVCPPLKSAVGARLATSDANADALGLRVFTILKTIHNSIDLEKPVPQHLLHSIGQFKQLLIEIQTAMEVLAKENHFLHVLRLRRNESQLAKFTARLELLAEEFTIGTMAAQTVSLAHIKNTVQTVSTVASALEYSNSTLEHSITLLRSQVKWLQCTVVFLA
ncbi:hypothetical protein B0H16DRAFT_1716611 [Mycena metata]|uniref:Uncharacterized protein n=1 Tax=Mycena metata TaxID=1033252 RepID=A0AAD7JLW1_9AGAR|nr:hypothetical protein B0H16DRAFT_1716611 [Mycena metata]